MYIISDDLFLIQNSFPMREWHVKHMEKTVVKFVTGLSVLWLLKKIRSDSSFSSLRKNDGSIERLDEVEKHFLPSREKNYWY